MPIFVDSPLAVSATEVFRMHPEEWDDEVQSVHGRAETPQPVRRQQIEYVRDQSRSKQLNYLTEPAMIISASGMAESGRILHHLKNNIENPENTILFVGFQAENTLGRRLVDGQKLVKIFGEEYHVRAQVVSIDGLQRSRRPSELLEWARPLDRIGSSRPSSCMASRSATQTLAEQAREEGMSQVTIPRLGDSYEF